jgi:hypothetical protein
LALRRLFAEIELNAATFLLVPGSNGETRFNFRFKKAIELGKEPFHLPDIGRDGGSLIGQLRMTKRNGQRKKSVQKEWPAQA